MTTDSKCAFVFLITVLSGCQYIPFLPGGRNNILIKEWVSTDVSNVPIKDGLYNDSADEHFRILRLYKNGKFSDFYDFTARYGYWKLNLKTNALILESEEGKDVEFCKFNYLYDTGLELVCYLSEDMNKQSFRQQVRFNGSSNESDFDPYSKKMNEWRIKPKIKETTKEIKQRIIDHLEFLRSCYLHASENDGASVKLQWIPTPVQLYYENAIYVPKWEGVPAAWKEIFYDSVEAEEGYEILKKDYRNIKIPGNDEGRFKRNIKILDQWISNVRDYRVTN